MPFIATFVQTIVVGISVGLATVGVPWSVINAGWALLGLQALNTISSKLFGPKIPPGALADIQVMTRSAMEHRKIVYGQALVSGPVIYSNLSGSDGEYLWFQVALAEGLSESIESIYFDGNAIPKADIDWVAGTGASDGTGTGNVSTAKWVGDTTSPGTTAVQIYYYLGDDAQPVSAAAKTSFASDVANASQCKGITHVWVKLLYNENTEKVWKAGPPNNIKALVKGRLIYDPRLDSTNGGSGSHRLADSTTWAYSDNPALCLADYLTQIMGVTGTSINWTSVASAADDCDVLVAIPPAASPQNTEKRFTCNGALSLGSTHKDNLDSILSSMDGRLSYAAGTWTVRSSVFASSTYSIVADDLVSEVGIRGSAPRDDRFNTIRGFFIDPARDYEAVEFPHTTAAAYVTRDGGKVLSYDLALPMTNTETMAQRVAYRLLEQGDNQIVVDVEMNHRGAQLIVGDVVDLTLSELSWTNKNFRIIEWARTEAGNFRLGLREDDSGDYTDPAVGEYGIGAGSSPTLPGDIVPPPTSLTATTVLGGVKLAWTDPPSRLYDHIEIWHSTSSGPVSGATLLAVDAASPFTDVVAGNQALRYYWIRAVNSLGDVSTYEPANSPDVGVSAYPNVQQLSIVPDPFVRLGASYWELPIQEHSVSPQVYGPWQPTYVADAGTGGTDALSFVGPCSAFGVSRRGPTEWDVTSANDMFVEVRIRQQIYSVSSPIPSFGDQNTYGTLLGVIPYIRVEDEDGSDVAVYTTANIQGGPFSASDTPGVWRDDSYLIHINKETDRNSPRYMRLQLYNSTASDDNSTEIRVDFADATIQGPAPVISVENLGAVGDGVTDDTAAIQAAIDAAQDSGVVLEFLPNTSYVISSDLTSTGNIVIEGNGATILINDTSPTPNGLVVNPGADVGSTTLSADAQINTYTWTVTDPANITEGSLLRISSDTAWHIDPDAEGLKKGELHLVNEVNGSVVQTHDNIFDNYDTAAETVTVAILTSCTFICRNLTIKYATASAKVGLEVRNAIHPVIENCQVIGAQTQGVNIVNCYGAKINNHTGIRSNQVGLGYGIQFNECTNFSVTNSNFLQCRRGVDVSGTIPSRVGDINGNRADGSGDASGASPSGALPPQASGFGGHETAEHITYRNNRISNVEVGIIHRGLNAAVLDNYFFGDFTDQCVLSNKGANITVDGNVYDPGFRPLKTLDVVATDDDEQKAPWFFKVVDPHGPTNGHITVTNNIVHDLKNGFINFTITAASPETTISNLIVSDNKINMLGSNATTTVKLLDNLGGSIVLATPDFRGNTITTGSASYTAYDTGITLTNPLEDDKFTALDVHSAVTPANKIIFSHDATDFSINLYNTADWHVDGLTGDINIAGGRGVKYRNGAASLAIRHDATDVNFTHAGTTDWNITGITSIQAGTVDADFDAITGTTFNGVALTTGGVSTNFLDETGAYSVPSIGVPTQITVADESADTTCFPAFFTATTGDLAPKSGTNLTFNSSTGNLSATQIAGITAANLVDSAANETIAGTWTFSNEVQLNAGAELDDNDKLKFGTGDDVECFFDGTDMNVDANSAQDFQLRNFSGDLKLRDDMGLLIYDSSDSSVMAIRHDGTDINFTHTSTTDWNISGITAIQAGSVDVDFDRIRGTHLEIADGISAPGTTSGQAKIYVDSSGGDLKIKFGDGTVKTIVTDT